MSHERNAVKTLMTLLAFISLVVLFSVPNILADCTVRFTGSVDMPESPSSPICIGDYDVPVVIYEVLEDPCTPRDRCLLAESRTAYSPGLTRHGKDFVVDTLLQICYTGDTKNQVPITSLTLRSASTILSTPKGLLNMSNLKSAEFLL
jgi:hypothetical protein